MKYAFLLLFALLRAALGQTFEVASVKPADPNSDLSRLPIFDSPASEMMRISGGPGTNNPGRIDYKSVTLKMLLRRAYGLNADQVSGPGWIDTERYDISAKLPPDTTAEQVRIMLQALLTERFRITMHRETKTLPIYLLTVAKNGPKLKPAQEVPKYKDQEEMRAATQKRLAESMAARERGEIQFGRWFTLPNATLAKFAATLSGNLDHPVKDQTQLEGNYSFTLKWTPESSTRNPDAVLSIFTAIEEQLGLKLTASKETTEVLVIDKADRMPVAN